MHEPQGWHEALHTPRMFADLIARGEAVEITSQAKSHSSRNTQWAVESDVYERYVGWDSQAMREHGICLDEQHRLQDLVKASSRAVCQGGGCFVCKARDCRSGHARASAAVLSVTNFGHQGAPMWLIHR